MTEPLAPAHDDTLLPMREVVRLTGVNPVTLRAWERRYGLLRPVRTEGGHRLYSAQDVASIHSIQAWTARGVSVGRIGQMLERQAAELASSTEPPESAGEFGEWLPALRAALARFDGAELERLYGQLFTLYPLALLFDELLLPLWRGLRQSVEYGASSQWLYLDAFLRARLLLRAQMNRSAGASVLLAPLPGLGHELELLYASQMLASDGLAVEALAAAQALEELPLVCRARNAAALVLWVPGAPSAAALRQLRRLPLAADCPLALAGEGADICLDALQDRAVACLGADWPTLRQRLAAFVAGRLDT